jgi:pimeloyl-ACP methyl ester carboxylesterase
MQPLPPIVTPAARLGAWLFDHALALGRWWVGATEHHHTSSDGVALRYLRVPRPGRPVVVLVHGFSDRPESFLAMARRLPDHDLILPALPGFHDGRSPGARAYDVAAFARWLDELLTHLGVDQAHFVGNSLGGATILALAHARPTRARSLVLLDAAGVEATDTPSVYDELRAGSNLFDVRDPASLRVFLRRVFHRPPPTPWPIGPFLVADMSRKADTFLAITADLVAEGERCRPQGAIVPLDQVAAPALVLWGAHDSLFPVGVARAFLRGLRTAKLEVLPDTGHVPHLERPGRCAAACVAFWTSSADPPQTP